MTEYELVRDRFLRSHCQNALGVEFILVLPLARDNHLRTTVMTLDARFQHHLHSLFPELNVLGRYALLGTQDADPHEPINLCIWVDIFNHTFDEIEEILRNDTYYVQNVTIGYHLFI